LLSRFAPLQIFFGALLVLAGAISVAVWLAVRQPWLGAEFASAGRAGLRVTQVDPAGPAAGRLAAGDRVSAVIAQGRSLSLAGYRPHVIPHAYSTFAGYESYMDRQAPLGKALSAGAITFVLADGGRVRVEPEPRRPLRVLSADFWLLHLFGFTACMIGLFVWVFRPRLGPARLLALSGLGFFAATWCNSIWTVRELALRAELFQLILRGNNLAVHWMLGCIFALLACYPQRLGRCAALPASILGLIGLIELNENLHFLDWPLHSFYAPLMLYYVAGAGLSVLQWRRSRADPVDRAALRWFFLSVFLSMGAALVGYFVPLLFAGKPLFSTTVMVGLAVMLYVGFALGVLRYRLFDLERWWFVAWAWFFGGVAVLVGDVVLALLLDVEPVTVLGLAVIAIGWVYFPLRQWLWQRFMRGSDLAAAMDMPEFAQRVMAARGAEAVDLTWQETLRRLLQPLAIQAAPDGRRGEAVTLADNGARLDVPGLTGGSGLHLRYADRGRRLFSRNDVRTVEALLHVGARIYGVRRAQEEGARIERKRIMRDLHDDVGGKLLSLMLDAPDSRREALARRALEALRDAVNTLDDEQERRLDDLLDEWQIGARERAEGSGTRLTFEDDLGSAGGLNLTPRQAINLRRVMDEALTNAIKHATPDCVTVSACCDADSLQVEFRNDGMSVPSVAGDADGGSGPGRGLHNMQTRIQELGGVLRWGVESTASEPRYRLVFSVPID